MLRSGEQLPGAHDLPRYVHACVQVFLVGSSPILLSEVELMGGVFNSPYFHVNGSNFARPGMTARLEFTGNAPFALQSLVVGGGVYSGAGLGIRNLAAIPQFPGAALTVLNGTCIPNTVNASANSTDAIVVLDFQETVWVETISLPSSGVAAVRTYKCERPASSLSPALCLSRGPCVTARRASRHAARRRPAAAGAAK